MNQPRRCQKATAWQRSQVADMPKLRIKRFYYRNDRVHAEIREVGGEFHGLNRTWHFNGQLAEELRYRHGRLHGISRLWDENGRLLGSFTMNHHYPRFRQGPQLFPVQTFVPKTTMKAFHKSVLPRTARLNVDRLDVILRQPPLHDLGDEL